jgi:hypothetical protein
MANRNRPASVAEPTAADKLRAADRNGDLDDPDATEVLAEVDTTRPLQARNGEHGHIDGPRGLHDFHDHDGGDTAHGHKRGGLLGRTAAVDEYVPPLAATDPPGADQTADPTPAGVPDVRASETGGDAGSDAAGSGRSTALVVTDATVLQDLGSRMEATERKIRGRLAEFKTVASLALLVDAALKQLDYDDLVSRAVVVQLKDIIDGWADDRGVSRS